MATTVRPSTTPKAVPARNVYGTTADIAMAKSNLGTVGYNYINTQLPKYVAPKAFGANDIQLANSVTPSVSGTDLTAKINAAVAASKVNAPILPTYNAAADAAAVNASYDASKTAIQTRGDLAITQGTADLRKSAADLQPQYQAARNQVDVQSAQSQKVLQDQMANEGLLRSGRNITGEAILGAARTNAIGSLTVQEQKMLDDTEYKINALKQSGVATTNAELADLEAKRNDALAAANQRKFDADMTTYNAKVNKDQQDLTNLVESLKTAYGVSQDDANRLMQNKTFNLNMLQGIADRKAAADQVAYNKQQDALDRAYKNRQLSDQEKETAYQHARDAQAAKIAASQRLSALAKSKSDSKKVTEQDVTNNLWALYLEAERAGTDDKFLYDNMTKIVTGSGSKGKSTYDQMKIQSAKIDATQRAKNKAAYAIANHIGGAGVDATSY